MYPLSLPYARYREQAPEGTAMALARDPETNVCFNEKWYLVVVVQHVSVFFGLQARENILCVDTHVCRLTLCFLAQYNDYRCRATRLPNFENYIGQLCAHTTHSIYYVCVWVPYYYIMYVCVETYVCTYTY